MLRYNSVFKSFLRRYSTLNKLNETRLLYRNEMLDIGYTEYQVDNMNERTFQWYLKNRLTEKEGKLFTKCTNEQLNAIKAKLLHICSMNEIDDGYGMSPVPRKDIISMLKRGYDKDHEKAN